MNHASTKIVPLLIHWYPQTCLHIWLLHCRYCGFCHVLLYAFWLWAWSSQELPLELWGYLLWHEHIVYHTVIIIFILFCFCFPNLYHITQPLYSRYHLRNVRGIYEHWLLHSSINLFVWFVWLTAKDHKYEARILQNLWNTGTTLEFCFIHSIRIYMILI